MWIVMTGSNAGYKAHSFHASEQKAREWKECLEYSGADVALCFVDPTEWNDVTEKYTSAKKQTR